MDFPVWYVPFLTAPMLIPLIAIPHVIVAQFAVGGGFLLADMVSVAHRHNYRRLLDRLKRFARFFILITVVFGAVTGVGIWWTIGLTSPRATQTLIRIFVFGWASEWVAFAIELLSAFAFYYGWDRLHPEDHVRTGWLYAISAWVSLVLITGITSFMLTSGTWRMGDTFFHAFLNPSFIPQTLIRTGGSFAIASLFVGLFISFHGEHEWTHWIIRRTSKWALGGMVLILIGGIWYFLVLPDHAMLNIMRAPILVVMVFLNFGATIVVIFALAFGLAQGSRWITPPAAFLLFLAGVIAMGAGEFIREGARKPYLIDGILFSPGVFVEEVNSLNRKGLIGQTAWLQFYLQSQLDKPYEDVLRNGTEDERARVGAGLFMYHCSGCHAFLGYNGLQPIVKPWNEPFLDDALKNLHLANPAMPPWLGTAQERHALVKFLMLPREKGGLQ